MNLESVARPSTTDGPRTPANDAVSLPLYAGGLVVTLCGLLTVSTSIASSSGSPLGIVTILLALLGFAFSLACRHLKISSRFVEVGCLAFVLYIVYRLINQQLDISWFLGGADRTDTQLAAGLMWAAVLRSWTLVTDDSVMFSCVLSAAMIGLIGTQDVNTNIIVYFSIFVAAMVFLLIHQNFLQHRVFASAQERAQSFSGLLRIQAVVTIVCAVVVLMLGSALIVPAQAVFANISLASAIRGLVGSGHVRSSDSSGSSTRFSDDARLDIGNGSSWPTSSEVLLHVSSDDGQPHYWRGRTYDQYTGAGWESTQVRPVDAEALGSAPAHYLYSLGPDTIIGEGPEQAGTPPRQRMVAIFSVIGDTSEFYYADEPRSLLLDSAPTQLPRLSADGRVDLGGLSVASQYTIASSIPADMSSESVRERLQHDGTDYPDDIRAFYLDSPDGPGNVLTTTGDVRAFHHALAEAFRSLPPHDRSPFDKAEAIQKWISNQCVYSLAVPPTSRQVDHVRDFLFHSRRGYCDLFASSMVVLCRVAGIPARVATGFDAGDRDDTGFNLRAMDKHAWAEVYFPHDHWEVFDPTIGTQTDGSLPARHVSGPSLFQVVARLIKGAGVLPKVAAVVILALVLYILRNELYAVFKGGVRNTRTLNTAIDTERHYALLLRALSSVGLPRYAWETPSEYELRVDKLLAAEEAATGAYISHSMISSVTAAFIAARYGADSEKQPGTSRADLTAFTHAAARMRRTHLLQRIVRTLRLLRKTSPA